MVSSGIFAACQWGVNLKDGGWIKRAQVVIVMKDKDRFDAFKYQQDLSSKIWIALVSVLLVLYFWKDIAKT